MYIHDLLNIETKHRCISVCGSGGKSSLCYALAKESASQGKRAAITTTTHIGTPQSSDCSLFLSDSPEELRQTIREGKIPICGKRDGMKLCFGGEKQFRMLLNESDIVYVEADGSRMLPLKYPNATEPVLREETDKVIVVCGLSALNRPLAEVCQRISVARKCIPGLGEIADAGTVAEILWNGYGRYSPTFVLNQADSDREIQAGNRIKNILESSGAEKVVLLSLHNTNQAYARYF